jgi:hypothetical protein
MLWETDQSIKGREFDQSFRLSAFYIIVLVSTKLEDGKESVRKASGLLENTFSG